MKTFDSSSFRNQLNLSRRADFVISDFAELDKLVKFVLQHCETESDYNLLFDEVHFFNSRIVKFINNHICCEHSENIESTTCTSADN